MNIDETFRTALAHHQAGRFQQAEHMYRQVLQVDARHVQSIHLLGVLASQTGRQSLAIQLISDAIRLDDANAALRVNLGEAYREAGEIDQALACYNTAARLDRRLPYPHFYLGIVHELRDDLQSAADSYRYAILLKPDYTQAHFSLGNLLQKAGNSQAAIASFQRAVAGATESDPGFCEALLKLGSLMRELGRIDDARGYLRRAIQLRPDVAEGHFFLGNLEGAEGNWPLAIECYENAVRVNPNMAVAQARLGAALQTQKRLDAAMDRYRIAIQLKPDFGEAYFNLGTALAELGRIDEAVEQYELATRHTPDFISAHINLGAIDQDRGQEEQALEHFERALAIDPDAADPHFNRALILLRRGELTTGWLDYQARLRLPGFPVRLRDEPLWDGTPIPGKTLLVHAEQGLGDTLQFIRYLEYAKQRAGTVILQVQDALLPLLRKAGADPIFYDSLFGYDDPLPSIDFQIPLMSLPVLAGTTMDNIPSPIPYLSIGDELFEMWRVRLGDIGGFRVGIVWKGSDTHTSDRARSIPLSEFGALASVPGVTLISLQKRDGLKQFDDIDFQVRRLEDDWDEAAGPFVDTAAVMKTLDLVITADTAAAHLAGALGVPVWVALGARADWRWVLEREDTPWYPTMRLFRQKRPDDWTEVFARIATALSERKAATCPPDDGSPPV
jgi:tetratricopeptide (TPR) repeat protein